MELKKLWSEFKYSGKSGLKNPACFGRLDWVWGATKPWEFRGGEIPRVVRDVGWVVLYKFLVVALVPLTSGGGNGGLYLLSARRVCSFLYLESRTDRSRWGGSGAFNFGFKI